MEQQQQGGGQQMHHQQRCGGPGPHQQGSGPQGQRLHGDRHLRGSYDVSRGTDQKKAGISAHKSGAPQNRRQRHYKKLWEHVKSVHAGDAEGGRHLPCEMSVEELVKVCGALPPDASAVSAVSAALAYLDSRAMAAFMKELAKTQQLARAMELFDWLKALPQDHELYGLCDVYTFTTAISLMGPTQQLRRALELVGEMRARGLQCNVHTYSALMNVCIKCDACDLALDVFRQMHEDKIRPNVVTYNTLVDVYGKTGQWDKAVRVLDDMRKEDLEPEVRTFNTAIIACNMCGQPHEALKVYQKLLDAGLQPIATTYTALISAHGKAGQLDKALDTFQAMIRHGCERSVITYSALISACEKAGKWELALQLFDQMQCEGCTPNTVTYNSLITACQQGGQAEKACEVFEQMKYHGCRPDVVTYSALISAHNKALQWHKCVRAFEHMHTLNCKPDSHVYQTIVQSLWSSGVAWAQARAWQLYMAAARNWQYRFTIQLASSSSSSGSSPQELEYVVPSATPGVAVLALRRWLADLQGQVLGGEPGSALLAPGGERVVLSLGRSRHAKEPSGADTCQALLAALQGFKAPFRPGHGTLTAASNLVVAEVELLPLLDWLRGGELPELLALLVPPSVAHRQPSPLGHSGHGGGGGGGSAAKRMSFGAELADDSKLQDSCQRAFDTVTEFEAAQGLAPEAMDAGYLGERAGLIGRAFGLASQVELPEEVVFDAVLLMDRVMSTGADHDAALGGLFVAAALRLAALQTVPGSDAATMSGVPSDALLCAATGFPEGSVAKMEDNIRTALQGDTKCISMLRTLKLYLERMGADSQQDIPAAAHFSKAMLGLLRSVLLDPLVLRWRPAVMAAATLAAARAAVGCYPAFPVCLQQLTGLSLAAGGREDGAEDEGGDNNELTELAAAVAAVEPLAATAGLAPPARASPTAHFGGCGGRPMPGGGHLFGSLGTPAFGSQNGSGYSTPSHSGTPTGAAAAAAAVAAQMQFGALCGQKSLLDAVARQHGGLHRAGSDMSSAASGHTCSDAGSTADLQTLLSASAMAGSPLGGFMPPSASEPALAAAMAGLQLGMMQQQHGGMGGGGMSHMPWLGGGLGGFDPYQGGPFVGGPQGSRLQQMTGPYITPAQMQHALMVNNAAQMLR